MSSLFQGKLRSAAENWRVNLSVLLLLVLNGSWTLFAFQGPDQIDFAMYFNSSVRDSQACGMEVVNGELVLTDKVSNPGMSCPDMTAWQLYTRVIQENWWSDYSDEIQNWPAEPYPLCEGDDTPADNCCIPGDPNNDPDHCPTHPGKMKTLQRLDSKPVIRKGRPSIMGHFADINTKKKALASLAQAAPELPVCDCETVVAEIPTDYESVGRVIRQTNSELTIRNEAFHDFVFENNLYNINGIEDVFNHNSSNLDSNAPYRRQSLSAANGQKANLSKIDFPSDAIMIKSNWLHECIATKLGLKMDEANPYISKNMETTIFDASGNPKCRLQGKHLLMALHISSKDIPNWVWATFEHVNLPGRCDFTGCNDSYGYKSSDTLPEGAADNFVKPQEQNDQLNSPSMVFKRGELYPVETIRPALAQVFKGLNIGTQPAPDPLEPHSTDTGWLSYRLKGTQTEFVDSIGRPTYLGNSITEAGFMDRSSCISCHSRAGIGKVVSKNVDTNEDDVNFSFFKLGVFINSLTDYGYGQSTDGVPNKNWFNSSSQPPNLEVLQVDFVWGFFNASPLVTPGTGTSRK